VTVDRSEPSAGSPQAAPAARAPDAWAARRTEEVLARAEAFAREAAPTPQLRALLDTATVEVYRQRAVRLLYELSPRQPAYGYLRTMLQGDGPAPSR